MKILVCISHVPDTTTKIQFDADGSGLNRAGVTFVINPYDEFGLSRALGLKESGVSVHITALCVGGPEVEPTLRKALAIGANDAVRINGQTKDSVYVARQIAEYAREKNFSIIFTGKESIDFNGGVVPGMIAEYLHIPFISFATKMDMDGDNRAILHREVDGGVEVIETDFPAVISTQKGIAEWRIPNMRGIMAARKKPLSVVSPVTLDEYVSTIKFDYPPAKGECTYYEPDAAAQLVDTLADKGLI